MPWWIWLLLVLFMLAMIVAGCIYVVLHGYHAFKDIAQVGGRVGERFGAMQNTLPEEEANSAPFFTRPLQDAANRYVDAHAQVIKRREAKRERHAAQWGRWNHFND
ncbi:hypothetical protein [Bifidobacterium moukalabense]|uniref:Uncharacterized protein n=1 Tax=Bifidobacterium moukalabense DSM 27321 TaxID=1435051 RepID=W4N8X8_9BIFI|nr:hypothetical protein [Bifidobacterium moukalabense]ETY71563.1 hypothetical protein BMOU_1061 [Bifidobacterium moukalabense DSM 27321]